MQQNLISSYQDQFRDYLYNVSVEGGKEDEDRNKIILVCTINCRFDELDNDLKNFFKKKAVGDKDVVGDVNEKKESNKFNKYLSDKKTPRKDFDFSSPLSEVVESLLLFSEPNNSSSIPSTSSFSLFKTFASSLFLQLSAYPSLSSVYHYFLALLIHCIEYIIIRFHPQLLISVPLSPSNSSDVSFIAGKRVDTNHFSRLSSPLNQVVNQGEIDSAHEATDDADSSSSSGSSFSSYYESKYPAVVTPSLLPPQTRHDIYEEGLFFRDMRILLRHTLNKAITSTRFKV
jgi:hypothetical protein